MWVILWSQWRSIKPDFPHIKKYEQEKKHTHTPQRCKNFITPVWLKHLCWFWIILVCGKSFQLINATFPLTFIFYFSHLLSSEMTTVVLRWLKEAALGGFHPFQKVFSKGIRRRLREKREIENMVVFKDHRDLAVSARETESKVQRSLTSNVFRSSDLQFTI